MVGRAAGGLALALSLVHLGGEGVRGALIYDRARADEVWRLVSASFVHYDLRHLLTNLLALLVLGSLLERQRSSHRLIVLTAATVLATGLALHVSLPEYARFAGASCLAYAFLGHLLALRWARQPRLTCALVVTAVAYPLVTAFDAGWLEELHGRQHPAWQLHLLALALGAAVAGIEQTAQTLDAPRGRHITRSTSSPSSRTTCARSS